MQLGRSPFIKLSSDTLEFSLFLKEQDLAANIFNDKGSAAGTWSVMIRDDFLETTNISFDKITAVVMLKAKVHLVPSLIEKSRFLVS